MMQYFNKFICFEENELSCKDGSRHENGDGRQKESRKGREKDEDATTASFSGEEKNRRDANERPARRRDSGRMRGSQSRRRG